MTETALVKRVRAWLIFFVIALVISGATAFPLVTELRWLTDLAHHLPTPKPMLNWLDRVAEGLVAADARYPFLLYGTDWLAFAHLVIAVAFWGPLKDPVRNIWVVQWAMVACAGIIPLALIAGPVRGIPFFWTLIDMSFGVVGIVPLLIVHRHIKTLERLRTANRVST